MTTNSRCVENLVDVSDEQRLSVVELAVKHTELAVC